MAHIYDVQTNMGATQVPMQQHHEHISLAEFERALLNVTANALNVTANVAGQLIIHRYTYRGRR